MQKIDKYIGELLYQYNCVIVPGFGGFLANYAPAKIHPVQHLFSPPSKHIVFNKNLKNNDGLLANYIASVQNITYTSAVEKINDYVQELTALLKKGEKVKIDIVGVLYLDVERNIQFKSGLTNFLTDAFGLTDFQSPPIMQDTIAKRVEKGLKEEGAKIVDLHTASSKVKVNYKRILAVAASLALVAGVFWISLKMDVLHTINYSNLNPFASKITVVKDTIVIHTQKKIVYKPFVEETKVDTFAYAIAETPVTAQIIKDEEQAKNEEVKEVVKIERPVIETSKEEKKVAEKPNKTENPIVVSTTIEDKQFHLVSGCFQVEENALKFLNELKAKNIKGSVIGKNKQGLYVVSCGDYTSRTEAEKGATSLREAQVSVWVFKSN